jgi:hypothetical protein
MRTTAAVTLAAVIGGSLAWAQAPRPAAPPGPSSPEGEKAFAERYAIVIERDIFARDRPHRFILAGESRQEKRPPVQKAPPRPEESMVLTGVMKRDGVFTAFIEDERTGTTRKAIVGDALASGKVANIDLSGLTFECEGRSTVLEVGRTLTGRISSLPQPAIARSAPAAKTEKAAPGIADRSTDRAGGRGGRFAGRNGGRGGRAAEKGSEKGSEKSTDSAVETVADSSPETMADPSPEKSAEKPAGKPADDAASGSEADLLERMRQRRLQEMKK